MESILTMFLTARQNSTSDSGASETTSIERGEASESTVSFLLSNYGGFMDLPDIIHFSFYQPADISLILDDCWETHGFL